MDNKSLVSKAISKYLDSELLDISLLGSGANGQVYLCVINKEPFKIAVKVTEFKEMLLKEANTINFINDRVDIKLPKILFYHLKDEFIEINLLGMTYLDGISANNINWIAKGKKRKAFTKSVIDNFLNLQQVTNDKYGVVGGEQFDSWIDYYRTFSKARLEYLKPLTIKNEFPHQVYDILEKSYDHLDIILQNCGKPTLIHGDYWAPNLLVNKKTLEFVGCVDPFNLMWAESEYEIFAMIPFPQLKLYQEYKKRVKTSDLFDLKSLMYYLFSEVYWFEQLGKNNFGVLKWVAKKLKKEFKKNNMRF